MVIDSTVSVVAIFSGLVGALASAYLGYVVRIKVKERTDLQHRKSLAHVHFLILTDFVASDFYLKEFITRISKSSQTELTEFNFSHKAATFLASKFEDIEGDSLKQMCGLIKPFIDGATDSMGRFVLSQGELAELDPIVIYHYNRFMTSSMRLKVALEVTASIFEKGDSKLLDASILHGLFLSFRRFADASGILRTAFKNASAVSDSYSLQCLSRSYTAIQEDVKSSFENSTQLEKAKKAAAETAQANTVLQNTK